jgi:hypothetical protein
MKVVLNGTALVLFVMVPMLVLFRDFRRNPAFLLLLRGHYMSAAWTHAEEKLVQIRQFHPLMSAGEIAFLERHLNHSQRYFEFGSGGSTAKAFLLAGHVTSVESDVGWHQFLQTVIGLGARIRWITVDLKVAPNTFGAPGSGSSLRDWVNYTRAYRREFNADLVLIDGRFRVACGLNLLPLISDETIVMYHDFTVRPRYFYVLKYYDLIEIADTSVTLRRKKNVMPPPAIALDYYEKQPFDRASPMIPFSKRLPEPLEH